MHGSWNTLFKWSLVLGNICMLQYYLILFSFWQWLTSTCVRILGTDLNKLFPIYLSQNLRKMQLKVFCTTDWIQTVKMATITNITKCCALSKDTINAFKCSTRLKHSKCLRTNLCTRSKVSNRTLPTLTCIRRHVSNRTLPSLNPLLDVQAFTREKLIREQDKIFTPTRQEVEEAEQLFISRDRHEIKFLKGAYYPEQAPKYNLPEVRGHQIIIYLSRSVHASIAKVCSY